MAINWRGIFGGGSDSALLTKKSLVIPPSAGINTLGYFTADEALLNKEPMNKMDIYSGAVADRCAVLLEGQGNKNSTLAIALKKALNAALNLNDTAKKFEDSFVALGLGDLFIHTERMKKEDHNLIPYDPAALHWCDKMYVTVVGSPQEGGFKSAEYPLALKSEGELKLHYTTGLNKQRIAANILEVREAIKKLPEIIRSDLEKVAKYPAQSAKVLQSNLPDFH